MDPRLRGHTPGERARARASAEGVDLDRLRRDEPIEYMMWNAEVVVTAAPDLAPLAAGMVMAAFPEREVFRAATESEERILAFPPLTPDDLRRFDRLLAPLVDRPEWTARYAYYREVRDPRGTRRELGLPIAPSAFAGGDAVVGPFGDEGEARGWGEASVRPPLVTDAFPMHDRWFCDVFRSDRG